MGSKRLSTKNGQQEDETKMWGRESRIYLLFFINNMNSSNILVAGLTQGSVMLLEVTQCSLNS